MIQFRLHTLTYIATVYVTSVLGVRDPYGRIEAETFDVNNGAVIEEPTAKVSSKWLGHIQPGDVIGYKRFNFSAETIAFRMNMACYTCADHPNRKMFLHLDTPTSSAFLEFNVYDTADHWLVVTHLIPFSKRPRGVHDLYFTFDYVHLGHVVGLDWFTFIADDAPPKQIQQVVHCPITDTVTSSISASNVVDQQSVSIGDCDEGQTSSTDTSKTTDSCTQSTATERKRKININFVVEDF